MSLLSLFHRSTNRRPSRNPGRHKIHKIVGGIKPAANKARSLRSRIMSTPIPEMLVLPLLQHKGTPATPVVKPGDHVLKGQKIAAADPRGVPVHAPTSGKIIKTGQCTLPDAAGTLVSCLMLASDGKDEAIETGLSGNFRNMSKVDLVERIRDAGIAGMGGAGFPTHLKIQTSTASDIATLIINAAECEPYITADEALIREHARDVVKGAEILQYVTGAQQCIIAIEDSKIAALAELKLAIADSAIEIAIVPAKYPAGSEKQLVHSVTGREVPFGEFPASIGVLLHNTGTAFAVYKAICESEPSISRITTVTGSTLKTPKNFHVLFGTPVTFLLDLCGIDRVLLSRIVVGGSLMGNCLHDMDAPIIKTTNCLIAGSLEEFPEPLTERACIRCGFCADACPVNLLPQQLYAHCRCQSYQQAKDFGLIDCIECGACAYVCPSHIPLVQYYRASKSVVFQQQTDRKNSEKWQSRFQFYQYRQKRESEQRIQARAEQPSHPQQIAQAVFSREKARQEISEAVARVKARRANLIATSTLSSPSLSSPSTEPDEKP